MPIPTVLLTMTRTAFRPAGADYTIYRVLSLHPQRMLGHHVLVPDKAVANRMKLYECDATEALNYIFLEHFARLNPTKIKLIEEPYRKKIEDVIAGKRPPGYDAPTAPIQL